MKPNKQAFTLIELLVVVLITGILAAVAIPQYQTAVEKSKYATLKDAGESITQAQHLYFLENGRYACQLTDLIIDIPAEVGCYIVQGEQCINWGCSLKRKGSEYMTYYIENLIKYCVVWDSADSPLFHNICKQETGKKGTHVSRGSYTLYKY